MARALCRLGARARRRRRRCDRRRRRCRACLLGRGAPLPDRLRALLRGCGAGRDLRYGPLLFDLRLMTLSVLIWLPLAISLLVSLGPRELVGRASFVGSLVTLGVAISFMARFSTGMGGLQFVTDSVWISALGIHYKLGLDGLNVALVLLTTVLFTASLAWAALREWERPRMFYFWFGLAESGVLGAFCAQDLALFVAFFDLMLLPFYFLIGSWGTGERVRATTKLVIYTLVGSFFMLAGAVATGVLASSQHGTPLNFTFSALQHLPLSKTTQEWIFLTFAAAFLVKMPLVPFHGWLADGYKAMPIPA